LLQQLPLGGLLTGAMRSHFLVDRAAVQRTPARIGVRIARHRSLCGTGDFNRKLW
jgi:hypothetical protein